MFTSAIDTHRVKLEKVFDRKSVAQISDLRRALGGRSRTTVFFALKAASYLTSYSHAGRYYTLKRIPKFDEHGLWFWGKIRFSKHGTLRATIVVLVCEAPAGRIHEELEEILGLRVHDTLRSLVETHALGREEIESVYVYLDPNPQQAAAQTEQRRRKRSAVVGQSAQDGSPSVDPGRTIEVLVAIIHAPKTDANAIAARLSARGILVSKEEVEAVFARYKLVKKTARSRSVRSRH